MGLLLEQIKAFLPLDLTTGNIISALFLSTFVSELTSRFLETFSVISFFIIMFSVGEFLI